MAEVSERSPLLRESQSNDEIDCSITQESGCSRYACCNPRSALHRYLALSIMCFLSFGSYFCYDNPAALQDKLTDEYGLTMSEYSSLYSWYSWPNVILSMIGGFLIDRVFGIRLGACIFASMCLCGQLLLSLAAYKHEVWLMYAARFVFGIGGESLAVAQNTYATSWFRGHELNMVFGIQLSMSRVGSTVNMNIMQPIYSLMTGKTPESRMGSALLLASATCVFSLLCACVLAGIDRRAKRLLQEDSAASGDKIHPRDILHFPPAIWLLCGICVAYYVSVFPFISMGQVFFLRKYQLSAATADAVNSLPYIVSAIASPICGLLIDKTGRNLAWVALGTIATAACHACLAFTWFNPYAVMVFFGVSYSVLAASLWPLVSYCLPPHQLATAYGIMQSVQNLGLASINLLTGIIVDAKGYFLLEVFFLMCLCASLLLTAILYFWDAASLGGLLNQSAGARQRKVKLSEPETE